MAGLTHYFLSTWDGMAPLDPRGSGTTKAAGAWDPEEMETVFL